MSLILGGWLGVENLGETLRYRVSTSLRINDTDQSVLRVISFEGFKNVETIIETLRVTSLHPAKLSFSMHQISKASNR